MDHTPRLKHEQIKQAFDTYVSLTEAMDQPHALAEVKPLFDKYNAGIFNLVVVGEEKRGKSTFINALLSLDNLVPVGTEPMTSVVYKIIYGEELRYRVFFLPTDPEHLESSTPEPIDTTAEGVKAYGTERGNPGNEKGVDFIAVEHPHPLLKAGLAIVDLPGLGGLAHEHAQITRKYLPRADAAFFVVDSTNGVLSKEEIATFELLRGYTDRTIVVQTKIDAVDTLQWQGWRERNIKIIEHSLGIRRDDLPYFTLSSTVKLDADRSGLLEDFQDSGFEPLLNLITADLIPRGLDRLAMPAAKLVLLSTKAIQQPIKNNIAILSTSSKEELERMSAEIKATQVELAEWQKEQWPEILRTFTLDFEECQRRGRSALQVKLDPSPYGEIVGGYIEFVRRNSSNTKQLTESVEQIRNMVVVTCSDLQYEVGAQFSEEADKHYRYAAEAVGKAVEPIVFEKNSDVANEVAFKGKIAGTPKNLMQKIIQVKGGAALGAALAGAVVVLTGPIVGLSLASWAILGAWLGGRLAFQEAGAREKEQVLQQLSTMLSDTVRRLQNRMINEFDTNSSQIKHAILANLENAVKQKTKDDQSALDSIFVRQKENQQEMSSKITTQRNLLTQTNLIIDHLHKAGVPLNE